MIQKGNVILQQCYPSDFFAADIERSKCLQVTSSNTLLCMHYVGSMIYHKFSHSDVSYEGTNIEPNGGNANIILELLSSLHNKVMHLSTPKKVELPFQS